MAPWVLLAVLLSVDPAVGQIVDFDTQADCVAALHDFQVRADEHHLDVILECRPRQGNPT